ncbi:hypothetical protein Hanom_Chr08g00742451 [Helianthus anomalus]
MCMCACKNVRVQDLDTSSNMLLIVCLENEKRCRYIIEASPEYGYAGEMLKVRKIMQWEVAGCTKSRAIIKRNRDRRPSHKTDCTEIIVYVLIVNRTYALFFVKDTN